MVQMMSNTPYHTLRLKFKKVGNLQYISHLDLVRTMSKIITRADLPLWYSEGFNPKPKMVFAAPLSIGTESVCEYMDLRLTDIIPPEDVMERINRNMTSEMQVTEAYYATSKLTELSWLSYTICFNLTNASEELCSEINALLHSTGVIVEKKGKPHEPVKTMDIRPLIRESSASFEDGQIRLRCVLCADASSFLNPEYVVKAIKQNTAVLSDPCLTNESYTIMRTNAYKSDMSEFK